MRASIGSVKRGTNFTLTRDLIWWHTANVPAIAEAPEEVTLARGGPEATERIGAVLFITADHGNAGGRTKNKESILLADNRYHDCGW